MTWYQRICPHRFDWSYNTHRQSRWCRLCGQQQRVVGPSPDDEETRALYESGLLLEAQKRILGQIHYEDV